MIYSHVCCIMHLAMPSQLLFSKAIGRERGRALGGEGCDAGYPVHDSLIVSSCFLVGGTAVTLLLCRLWMPMRARLVHPAPGNQPGRAAAPYFLSLHACCYTNKSCQTQLVLSILHGAACRFVTSLSWCCAVDRSLPPTKRVPMWAL